MDVALEKHQTQIGPLPKSTWCIIEWAHRSKPSCYFEGHEFWYLSPDSTSGCQGPSNKPSNTSESKRVKFYIFSTGGTPWKYFVPFGPPCRKNIKFHSLTFLCVWLLVWKPLASWGGIWAQISNFMTFEVARWFWSMCEPIVLNFYV